MPTVLWFRNDLRLLDNYALRMALEHDRPVWPVYCLDPRLLLPNSASEPVGAKSCDAHRVRFLLQSLEQLRANLQALGSDLLVVQAPAHEALPAVVLATSGATRSRVSVIAQEEPAWPERAAEQRVAEALACHGLGDLQLVWGSTCFHLDDLALGPDLSGLPESRGSFGVIAERAAHVRFPLPGPEKGALGSWDGIRTVVDALTGQGLIVGVPTEAETLGVATAGAASDPLAVMQFEGGEDAGLARVEEYIWQNEENLELYFDTRNGFLGRDFSSKFSPWLALGCLSPRWCYWQVIRWERGDTWYEEARKERQGVSGGRGSGLGTWKYDEWATRPLEMVANRWGNREVGFGECKSSYWLLFELESRDFMHFMARKHGAALFALTSSSTGEVVGQEQIDAEKEQRLRLWKTGKTGVPLVDACMRELARSGYLSNRGRMIVANFLCSDLEVPFNHGAQHFENVCIDHDASINWGYFKGCARAFGHWAVSSQSFGGIRAVQPLDALEGKGSESIGRNGSNVARQCQLYDPEGMYIRTWVRELSHLSAPACFAPWYEAEKLDNYPSPCVSVSWSVTSDPATQGEGGTDGAPFHGFSEDRVVSRDGTLRFLDFDQAKIGGNLELMRQGGSNDMIGEVAVRIEQISEGITYGAGGLAIGITNAADQLVLTSGRCAGLAWGLCKFYVTVQMLLSSVNLPPFANFVDETWNTGDQTVSCPRQPCVKCFAAADIELSHQMDRNDLPRNTWGWNLSGLLSLPLIRQGDVIGLAVMRQSAVSDADGGGIMVGLRLSRNGQDIGVGVSGLHLTGSCQWFFAVSGESESFTLTRLVL